MNPRISVIAIAMVIVLSCWSGEVAAQFQNNNRQQAAGLNAGAGFGSIGGGQQAGFGNQAGGFGNQGGRFGPQGGMRNQGGVFGQAFGQQARAGSAEAVANAFESMGGRERRQNNIDRFIENLNQMRDGQTQGRGQRRSYAPVRVKIRPAFKVTPIEPTTLAAKLQSELDRSIELSEVSASTRVTLKGRVATVTGTVADEHERQVLAKILSLQPGVSQVENQLVVQEKLSFPGSSENSGLPIPPPVE